MILSTGIGSVIAMASLASEVSSFEDSKVCILLLGLLEEQSFWSQSIILALFQLSFSFSFGIIKNTGKDLTQCVRGVKLTNGEPILVFLWRSRGACPGLAGEASIFQSSGQILTFPKAVGLLEYGKAILRHGRHKA